MPILLFFLFCAALSAQISYSEKSNDDLIDMFIKSKGYSDVIVFDASNVKQFWIDNSVVSKKDNIINIILREERSGAFESVPLKIQLANVSFFQNCRIDIIADSQDYSFSVLNDSSKPLAKSTSDENFISYSVSHSIVPLENTQEYAFFVKFTSKEPIISIKKLIMSFSDNKDGSFLFSPGSITITPDNAMTSSSKIVDKQSFEVSGKNSSVVSTKNLLVSDQTFKSSVKIKNIGTTPTRVHVGYTLYSQNRTAIDASRFPYKNNKTLTLLSSKKGTNTIIVDSYPEWGKNCVIALNAKDDLSDIPNETFISGKIVNVVQQENGHAEIELDKPLDQEIKTGTKIRIHGVNNNVPLYTNIKILQPDEVVEFSSTIKRDLNSLQYSYSEKAFPRGTCYITPIILSISVDPSSENKILITDFTVDY